MEQAKELIGLEISEESFCPLEEIEKRVMEILAPCFRGEIPRINS